LRWRLPLPQAGALAALVADGPPGGNGQPGPSALGTMLRPEGGRVHFLHFWAAFGKLLRVADTGMLSEDWLSCELETFRDQVTRRLDGARGDPGAPQLVGATPAGVSGPALADEVSRAAGMSAQPRFWQWVARTMGPRGPPGRLSLEDLTSLLHAWLKQAAMWKQASNEVAAMVQRQATLPVFLNIYDVSMEEGIQKINRVLAHEYSPLKLGGVFHAGVVVNGLEWSFGFSDSDTKPGVSCIVPRSSLQHHFRETVLCGHTHLPASEVTRIVSELLEEYPGPDYDLLRRNCCHFADDFSRRLGAGRIPGWVHRLARLGARVDTALQVVANRRLLSGFEPDESDDDR